MATPDQSSLIKLLHETIDLAHRVGAVKEAETLEGFSTRLETEKLTSKPFRVAVYHAMDQAFTGIREIVLDMFGVPRRGKRPLAKEYERLWLAFNNFFFPPKFLEMDISKFAGSEYVEEKMATYRGDPGGVQPIVEHTIELVRRYSQTLGSGDFEGAYALMDSGLRGWMSCRKFVSDHERAAKQYHGPALEFRIGRLCFLYADETARKKSPSGGGWPKGTLKENRRGLVLGFWIRDRAAQTGCGGRLWIAEEGGEYRIAMFNFYRP